MVWCDVERRIAWARLGNRASCGMTKNQIMVLEVRPPDVSGWYDCKVTSRNAFICMTKTHQITIATGEDVLLTEYSHWNCMATKSGRCGALSALTCLEGGYPRDKSCHARESKYFLSSSNPQNAGILERSPWYWNIKSTKNATLWGVFDAGSHLHSLVLGVWNP